MARGLAVALVAAWVDTAHAGGTRKVDVSSTPEGASVYLNDPGEGELCKTPCTIDAPVGKTPIILQLEGYEPVFESLNVPRSGKKVSVSYTLQSAVGTLIVHGPDGATIQVDEQDKGKIPDKVDVESGSHHVVVTFKNKTLYDDFVRIDTGAEVELTAKQVAGGDGGGGTDGGGTDGGGTDGGGGSSGGEVHQTAPAGPRGTIVTGGIQVDIGFRRLSYDNPRGKLTPQSGETEDGQVLVGPALEVWPTEMLHLGVLRGLSLFVRYQIGVNHQELTTQVGTGPVMPAGASTAWSSLEASIRQRWVLADAVAVVASGGYVRDALGFDITNQAMPPDVPDADYQSVRLGARVALLGDVAPYIEAENRFVVAGGHFASQFMSASATGIHAAAGVAVHIGSVAAKAEGEITSYSWTFSQQDPNADGASDKVFGFAALLAYQY
ncbi:MAG TPA: PEGA domain-containing protein [Kofleriaceae bacterium]|nr:PEGA domain-containing protein [Kofleriaceae bacterium]